MSFREAFPDFDPSGIPTLGADWVDDSWHNDACPKFRNDRLGLQLWVNYTDPADREMPDADLYVLERLDPDGEPDEIIAAGADWAQIARMIADADSAKGRA